METTTPSNGGETTDTGPKERVLSNGGPTLDDEYPNQGTNDLADLGASRYCGYIRNGSDKVVATTVPVLVTGLSAVDQAPAGSTAFTVTECRDTSVPCCDLGSPTVYPTCVGRTLPPWQSSSRAVCWMGVQVAGRNGNHSTHVRIDYAAVCTASTGDPCRRVAADRPSPSHPVTVRWSTERTVWKACFASHANGYYGADRDGDGCPDRVPDDGPTVVATTPVVSTTP